MPPTNTPAPSLPRTVQPEPPTALPYTTQSLKADSKLTYKLKILIHDLCNVAHNRASQQRLESATDELYLSPYFTSSEAEIVRSAIVSSYSDSSTLESNQRGELETTLSPADDRVEHIEAASVDPEDEDLEATPTPTTRTRGPSQQTVEQAIHAALATFFEKRRASGDARPCGPHTLAPVYLDAFGFRRGDVADEAFLRRLRREGVPDEEEEEGNGKGRGKGKGKRKGKGERKR
ncbi:hypothetical protein K491DRAFT_712791 [Lophiostoma macrostomum CBS 122681]|uniref:Uncharacterized protein n=1 Tax=Lophiostoma macrostomum CBS 122681 TaxID=1314788 RepID=A0A6A6TIY4_9PLEO|nr:hypothetical protein K491DRAFT_712791 [Lophiostoma macrostomum CBS 122681]